MKVLIIDLDAYFICLPLFSKERMEKKKKKQEAVKK